MKENKEKLEAYKKSIEGIDKLSFKQAKELYLEMNNEEDLERKKEIRNQLIQGTLYVVYEKIEKSGLLFSENSVYDMDDIVSSAVEVWIRTIDSGMLLSALGFAHLFQGVYRKAAIELVGGKTFYERVHTSLLPDTCIDMQFNKFVDSFLKYFEGIMTKKRIVDGGYIPNVDDMMALTDNLGLRCVSGYYNSRIKFYFESESDNQFYSKDDISRDVWEQNRMVTQFLALMNFFDTIVSEDVVLENADYIKELMKNIKYFKTIFVNNGLDNANLNIDNVAISDDYLSHEIDKELLTSSVCDFVFNNPSLSAREKFVLYRRFWENSKFDEIAKDFNGSRGAVQQREEAALKKLGCGKNEKKAKELYRCL